ncbi:MAG: hypothetical protein K0S46_2195 [Moraxellaceae bacterium]|jgi:uncharacterized membrane protein YfcA|nr:hypothetical protein [Moraxellaceae bacterium]
MTPDLLLLLCTGIFLIAFLYSSVGHAGASGYIAVMTLIGLAPATIKPLALTLNILVATIGSWQFWRAGHFSGRLLWPFAVLALPMAFLGGYLNLPTPLFKVLLGAVLLYSALHLLLKPPADSDATPPSLPAALAVGAGIGLLSGLTGTGGGIFLTPLLLFMHWAKAKQAAAVSAVFILLNSSAGLLGSLSSSRTYPDFGLELLAAAGIGGLLGSWLGSRRLEPRLIKRFLAAVLVIAGTKLAFAL